MKTFVFIIHPRTVGEVTKRFWWARYVPNIAIYGWMRLTRRFPSMWICSSFDVYGMAKGHMLCIPFTARQMLKIDLRIVRDVILKNVLFAQDVLKADVIGLGALTASVTNGGKWLIQNNAIKAFITHGDTYAVAIAMDGLKRILEKNRKIIAIVGATGIIGKGLTSLIAQNGNQLILIGRNDKKLKMFADTLNSNSVRITKNIEECCNADIVITATNHSEAILKEKHLKKGTIIYDVSQPQAVSPTLLSIRKDVVKIDGCLVNVPGIDLKFDLSTPKGTTFACLAETIIQTIEDIKGHHVGDIDISHIKILVEAGKKYNFTHAPFSCFGRPLTKYSLIDDK